MNLELHGRQFTSPPYFEISIISVVLHLNKTNTSKSFATKTIKDTKITMTNLQTLAIFSERVHVEKRKVKKIGKYLFLQTETAAKGKTEPGLSHNKLEIMVMALIWDKGETKSSRC